MSTARAPGETPKETFETPKLPLGQKFYIRTKYATSLFGSERDTVEEAWPGDVVGLVNASELYVGDSLYSKDGLRGSDAVTFPSIPAFPPELIATAYPRDLSRSKQFKKGLDQLAREGVVQILHRGDDPTPVLAAVGAIVGFLVLDQAIGLQTGIAIGLVVIASIVAARSEVIPEPA